MTAPIVITREWRAEERADGCYVIETGNTLDGNITYGPMPPYYVLLLIGECRDAIAEAAKFHAMHMAAPMTC